MKTFEDLEFKFNEYGIQAIKSFKNGYGISVIKSKFSYGGDERLYECTVLKDGSLCYDTPVTDDVIGWCTEEKVTEIMKQIQEL